MKNINIHNLIIEKSTNNIGAFSSYTNKNKEVMEYINQNIPSECIELKTSEKLWYYINEIDNIQLCICGCPRKYIGLKNGYYVTCGSKKCTIESRKNTNIEKYGFENPMKNKDVVNKGKQTVLENWDNKHYMYNNEVKNKIKQTNISKYGVEYPMQNEDILQKSKESFLKNDINEINEKRVNSFKKTYNVNKEEIINKKNKTIIDKFGSVEKYKTHVQEKIKQTSIEKYGVEHFFKNQNVIDKRIQSYITNKNNKIIQDCTSLNIKFISSKYNENKTDTIFEFECQECNENFDINRQLFGFRKLSKEKICLKCNPISNGTSRSEKELYDFIIENTKEKVIYHHKISNIQLDIYVPEIKIAFEYNGLYWHSDLYKHKSYHKDKSQLCQDNDISLIHIWEDDWLYRKDIIKSIIRNRLNSEGLNRIYARKCTIKEISFNDSKIFLNENHIQGNVVSKYRYGLYYNDELVSVMTFGRNRINVSKKSNDNEYELLRFCNRKDTIIIGGASRLLKKFIKDINPIKIKSFSDRSIHNGNVYENIGFTKIGESDPNYHRIVDGFRKNRFLYRKDVLVRKGYDKNMTENEIMKSLGYYRVFDCGSSIYEMII